MLQWFQLILYYPNMNISKRLWKADVLRHCHTCKQAPTNVRTSLQNLIQHTVYWLSCSIIFRGDHQDVEASATSTSGPQALVSRYAWGRDYHHVMRRLLRKLRNHLLTLEPSAIVAPFSDENAVLNRAWTRAAGLGFIGKNTMLIHRELGSWTFLGGLITSADLLTNTVIRPAQHSLCGTCDKCMKACPTQAIQAPFILDGNRCISTWNIENPTPPINKDEDRVKGHGWAFGCDICQEICPWNKFEKTTSHEAFQAKPGHIQWDTHSLPKELIGSPIRRAGEEQLFQLTTRALDGRHMTHRRIKRTERLNRM
jgi:epoxyqueuosine reductase